MNVHAGIEGAEAHLLALINGYRLTQAIYVVTVLGVPDLLAAGPRQSAELASATGADPDALHRVLRALAAFGILRQEAEGFALASLGACLRTDAPRSLKPWVEFIARPAVWNAWGGMLHTVRTGETAFHHLHGQDIWTYRAGDPEESRIFDAAMSRGSARLAEGLLAAYDFAPFRRIVDVGGGDGTLLSAILAHHHGLRGTLLDLPHVVAGGQCSSRAHDVADRFEVCAGSFFESVPAGADAYILKHVIHDWQDVDALTILRNCRAAMGPRARLILIERIVAYGPGERDVALADLNMLVNAGGRERSEDEFRGLLAARGLAFVRSIPLPACHFVIEAQPA